MTDVLAEQHRKRLIEIGEEGADRLLIRENTYTLTDQNYIR